jgi:hypothetical protein
VIEVVWIGLPPAVADWQPLEQAGTKLVSSGELLSPQ